MKNPINLKGRLARENKGATLAIVIACTLVILLVGIAFIVISLLFGGGREVQNAVDSSALNTAKYGAYGIPAGPPGAGGAGVPYSNATSASADQAAFLSAYLQQPPTGTLGNLGPTDASGLAPVDLVTFNRLVAAALVIQMNASADGNAQGLANAAGLFAAIEGSSNSYGATLTAALQDSGWASKDYGGVSNAARMIGLQQGAPDFNANDYQVGWIYQKDNMPCNVDLSAYNVANPQQNALLPFSDITNNKRMTLPATMFASASGAPAAPGQQSFMAGYQPISVGANSPTYYGVPNGPLRQPHLESNATFQGTTAPAGGVPPNAFRVGGTATTQGSQANNLNMDITSIATVGVQDAVFQPGLVNGFLLINNGGPASFTGNAPNLNTVCANQLMSGITVDPGSGFFTMATDPNHQNVNLIQEWQNTAAADRTAGSFPPTSDGNGGMIYNASGAPATWAQINAAISPSPGNPTFVNCTDTNSSSPDGNPACSREFSPSPPAPNGLPCAGDVAYNGYTAGQPVPPVPATSNSLTAAEMTQLKAGDLFGDGNSPTGTVSDPSCFNFPAGEPTVTTGIRLYQEGLPTYANEYPCKGSFGSSQASAALNAEAVTDNVGGYRGAFNSNITTSNNPGQVTVEAGLYDLLKEYFEAAPNGAGTTVKTMNFLIQRLCEIKPSLATGLQINVGNNANGPTVSTNSDEINQVLGMGSYSYQDNNNQASPPFPLKLGTNSFIFLNPTTNKLTVDNVGPAQAGKLSANANNNFNADGTNIVDNVKRQSAPGDGSYDVFLGVTDAYGSHNIHDQLFRSWGTDSSGGNFQGGVQATDTLTVTASSGATGGMLALIKLQEYTTGGVSGALPSSPTLNLNNRN